MKSLPLFKLGRSQTIDDLLKSKHGEKMTGAQAATLTIMGLNPKLFGLPGGAILPVEQWITYYSRLHPELEYHGVKHESHAVHAAAGWGALTGQTGIAEVTSGPGWTNAATGLYDALMEGYPVMVVSGNVNLSVLNNPNIVGFQASKAAEGAAAITKRAVRVDGPDEIQRNLIESYIHAMTPPFGSVLVDLPKLDAQLSETRFEYFEPPTANYQKYFNIDQKAIHELAKVLQKAQRPFIVLGRGALNARENAWTLIEKLGIPFGYTLKGKGVMPDDHPQCYGLIGMHGKKAVNQAIKDSDLVLNVATMMDDRAYTNGEKFTDGKKALINIYPPNALARTSIDYLIQADVNYALSELLNLVDGNVQHEKLKPWNAKIRESYEKEEVYNDIKNGLSPVDLMRAVDSAFNPDVLLMDVGEHQMHAAKLVGLKSGLYNGAGLYGKTSREKMKTFNKQVLTSGTAGTMGSALPYAQGAYFAMQQLAKKYPNIIEYKNPKFLVVMGDGGLEMHISALWLAAANYQDIPIALVNNRSYGQVFEWLDVIHNKETDHAATSRMKEGPYGNMPIPNFRGVAMLYNLPYWNVQDEKSLVKSLNEFANEEGPRLLEAVVGRLGAYPLEPAGGTVEQTIMRPPE